MTLKKRVRTAPRRPSRYKSYLIDNDQPIPRTTFYRMRKERGLVKARRKATSALEYADEDAMYPGARISVRESIVTIMALVNHHHGVNKSTLRDLLKTIHLNLPKGVKVRHFQSLYKFVKEKKKYFKLQNDIIVTHHHVCPVCFHLFDSEEELCPTEDCETPHYKPGTKDPTAFFVELDAEQQIKEFFTDPKFVAALNYKETLPNDGVIRDVYDGKLYKSHKDFFTSRNNISLMWHTDGVQVYKSKDYQLWPVSAVINELPPSMRFSKRNVVLLGMYYGPGKPLMNSFLTPMVLSLNKMHAEGFDIKPGGKGPVERCRVLTLGCTMDLPAMCATKNVQQFNGSFGCGLCEVKGVSTKRGRGSAKTYPYRVLKPKRRTKTSMFNQAVSARKLKKPVTGVKGHTVVSLIRGVDVSVHFLVDYMHGTCIGVMKRLLESWLASTSKKKAYYLGDHLEEINRRLTQIAPPSCMRRYPKPLTNYKLNYKASEYRDLLIFYILPVVKGILPMKYWYHLAMLVRGVYILCLDNITSQELSEAKCLLDQFHKHMESYYDRGDCTINVHNLGQHMADCVDLAGPLYTHSCFFFEDVCGHLGKMVTGPRNPVQQIVQGIERLHEYRNAARDDNSYSEEVKQLLKRDPRNLKPLEFGFKTASKYKPLVPESKLAKSIKLYNSNLADYTVQRLERVEREGAVFTVASQKQTRHRDCYVCYEDEEGSCNGSIQDFLVIHDGAGGSHHVAVIAPFLQNASSLVDSDDMEDIVPHISDVKSQSDILHVVPLNQLKTKLVFVPNFGQQSGGYVTPMPAPYLHN